MSVADDRPLKRRTKSSRNEDIVSRLGCHWEFRAGHPPTCSYNSSGNYQAHCAVCDYSAAPQTFYKLHAQEFCQMHASSLNGAHPRMELLVALTELSSSWRDGEGCDARSKYPIRDALLVCGSRSAEVTASSCDPTDEMGRLPRGVTNGTGREAAALARFVVQSEQFLDEEGLWAHRFKPMVNAVLRWNRGGEPPDALLHSEYEGAYVELVARVAERKNQHTLEYALETMAKNRAITQRLRPQSPQVGFPPQC